MKRLIIALEEIEDGQIRRVEKAFPQDVYSRFSWSTWAEILYLEVQCLEAKLDGMKQ